MQTAAINLRPVLHAYTMPTIYAVYASVTAGVARRRKINAGAFFKTRRDKGAIVEIVKGAARALDKNCERAG